MARANKTPDDSGQGSAIHNDASAALQEIDDAVKTVEAGLAAPDQASFNLNSVAAEISSVALPGVEIVADASAVADPSESRRYPRDESHEERVKRMIKRALQQKKRGREELDKAYDGVMSVKKSLRLFDVNIASSAERFLGTIDLTLNTVVRRGTLAIGTAASEEIMDRFSEMVADYLRGAEEALASAKNVLQNEMNDTLEDWLEPDYTSTAFECDVQAKHRFTLKLIAALTAWDKAIFDMNVLEWNGKVDAAQVAQIREQERRGLSAIYAFAVRTLQGMKRRTEVPARSNTPSANAQGGVAANEERAAA